MDEFIFNLDVDDSAVQKKIAAILNKIEEANPSLNINTDGIENKIKSLISKIKSDFSSGSINSKDLINFGTLIRESDKFTDSLKTDISDIINMLSNIENVSLNKQLKSDLKNVSTELKNSSVKDFLDFDIKEAKSKIQKLKKEIRSVPDELLDTRSSIQEAFGVDLSKVVSSKDGKLLRDRKSLVDLFDESEGTLSDDLFYQYLLDMEEIKQRGIELDESIRKSDERLKKRYVLENSQKKYDDIYNDAKNSISEEQNWKNFVNQKKEDIKKIQSQIDEYQKRVENKDSSSSSRTKKSNYTNRNSDAVDSSSTLNAQQYDSLNISSLQNAVDNLASTVEGATKKISVAVSDLNSEKKQKSDTVSEYRASDLLTNDEKTNYNESIASFETAEGKVSSYKEKLLELKRTYEELNRITASNELIDKKSFDSTEKKVADLKKNFSSLSKELSSDKFDISEDIKSNYNETIVSQQKANDKLKSLYEREKEYFLYDKNPNGSLLSKKEKEYELAYTKFEKLKKEADKYAKESGYFDSTYREAKDEINKVQSVIGDNSREKEQIQQSRNYIENAKKSIELTKELNDIKLKQDSNKYSSTDNEYGNILSERYSSIQSELSATQKTLKEISGTDLFKKSVDSAALINKYTQEIEKADFDYISNSLLQKSKQLYNSENDLSKISIRDANYQQAKINTDFLKSDLEETKSEFLSLSKTNIFAKSEAGSQKILDTMSSVQEYLNKIESIYKTQNKKSFSNIEKLNKLAGYSNGKTSYDDDIVSLEKSSIETKKLDSYNDSLNKLKEKNEELKNISMNFDGSNFEEASEKVKTLRSEIDKMLKDLNNSKWNYTGYSKDFGKNLDVSSATGKFKEYLSTLNGVDPSSVKFTQNLKSLNGEILTCTYRLKDNDNILHTIKATYNSTTGVVKSFETQQRKVSSGLDELISGVKIKFVDAFKYFASFGAVEEAIQAVRTGIQTITELDTAMVEVRKVSDETEESYSNFTNTVKSMAKEVASTNAELMSSTAGWLRTGESFEDSAELAKNAAMFVNVGDGIDIDTATSDMVTSMKAFNIEAKDSMQIVDAFNEVGNNYAITADGIGDALSRSASSLAEGGNSFAESIAMATAMNEIVQDTSVVGSTLKILGLRLRGATVELEAAGESTDGMAKSTSSLREKIETLTNVDGLGGFDIMEDENTLKSTIDIMDGIAQVYDKMSDIDQAALLELIAGKNRANGVAALLQNWEQVGNVLTSIQESEGSAEKENEAILNSIEGKSKILQASLEGLWSSLIDAGDVKSVLDFLTSLSDGLTSVIDKVGVFGAALGGIGVPVALKSLLNMGGFGDLNKNFEKILSQGNAIRDYKSQISSQSILSNIDLFDGLSNYDRKALMMFKSVRNELNSIESFINQSDAIKSVFNIGTESGLKNFQSNFKGFENVDDLIMKQLADADGNISITELIDKIDENEDAYALLSETFKKKDGAIFSKNDFKELKSIISDEEKLAQVNEMLSSSYSTLSFSESTFINNFKNLGASITSFISANMALIAVLAAVGVAFAAYKAYESTTLDAHRDRAQESVSEYESAKASVDSLNSELEENNSRITELQSKGPLTYVEQSELDSLRDANALLKMQIDLEKQKADLSENQAIEDQIDLLKKYGDYDWTYDQVVSGADINAADFQSQLSSINDNKNSIKTVLVNYLNDLDEYESAIRNGYSDGSIEAIYNSVESDKEYLLQAAQDLMDTRSLLSSQYKTIKEQKPSSVGLTRDEQEIIDAYESAGNQLRNIYQVLDPGEWNSMQFDQIFNVDGIEKTKEELISLAESGELTNESFGQWKNLRTAIEDSNLILEDGKTSIQSFIDQINALKTEKVEASGLNFDDIAEKSQKYIEAAKQYSDGDVSNELFQKIQKYSYETGLSIDAFVDKFKKFKDAESYITSLSRAMSTDLESMQSKLASFSSGIDSILSATSEQGSNGFLSTETYESLISANEEYEKAVEKTSSGWRVNLQEINEISRENAKSNLKEIETEKARQANLYSEYVANLKEAKAEKLDLASSGEDTSEIDLEISGYESAMENIKSTMSSLQQLEGQYKGITSAYNEWVTAQNTANEGSMYDNIYSGIESTKELWNKGLVGTDEFRSFVDMFSAKDLSNATSKEIADAYSGAISRAERYFTEDSSGAKTFLDDLKAINSEWVTENGEEIKIDFPDTEIPNIAEKLGISEDAITAMIGKLRDYGFEIEYDTNEEQIESISDKIQELKDQKIKLDPEVDKEQIDELDKEIAELEKKKLSLEVDVQYGSDGEIDAEATEEKIKEYQQKEDSAYGEYVESAQTYASSIGKDNEVDALRDYNKKRSDAYKAQMQSFSLESSYANSMGLELPDPGDIDWAIDFSVAEEGLNSLKSSAEEAYERMKLLGEEEYTFNFDDNSIESVSDNLSKAQEYYDSFYEETEDGSFQLKTDVDYSELEYATDILAYFTRLQQETENDSSYVMNIDIEDEGFTEKEQEVASKLQELKKKADTLSLLTIDPSVSTTEIQGAESEVESLVSYIQSQDPEILAKFGISDTTDAASIISGIVNSVDPDIAGTVSYEGDTSDLPVTFSQLSRTVKYKANTEDLPTTFATITRLVYYKKDPNSSEYTGTAYYGGSTSTPTISSYAFGTKKDWRISHNQTALVNEIGNEGIVRDGKFSLIEGGSQFVKLKKGDIIFNHKQTEQLLKYGHLLGNGRGKMVGGGSFANGTSSAFVSGSGGWFGGASSSGSYTQNSSSSSGSNTAITNNTSAVKASTASTTNLSKALDNFKKWFDWIEVKLDRMALATEKAKDAIELFYDGTKNMYQQYSNVSDQNAQVQKAIEANIQEQKANESAAKEYENNANAFRNQKSVRKVLTDSIISKIKNGTIDINSYSDNTKEAIEAYQSLYEKALDCKETVEDLKKEQRELELMKMENIQNYYDNQNDFYSSLIDASEAERELNQAIKGGKDEFLSSDLFTSQMKNYVQIRNSLTEKKDSLIDQMNDLVSRGILKEGTEDWYTWKSAIADVNSEIADTIGSMADLGKEQFDSISDFFSMKTDYKDTLDDQYQTILDYMETLGVKTVDGKAVEDYFNEAISGLVGGSGVEESKLSYLKEQLSSLNAEFEAQLKAGLFEEYSQQWYDMQSEIRDVENELLECEIAAEEYRQELHEFKVSKIDFGIENIQRTNDVILDQIDLYKTLGKTVSSSSYQELINNSEEELKANQEKASLIEEEIKRLESTADFDSSSEYYQQLQKDLAECNTDIIDVVKSQEEWNQAIFDLNIQQIDNVISRLESAQSIMESIMDFNEAQGESFTDDDYLGLIQNADEQIEQYESRAEAIQNEMDRILSNGGDVTSERYVELQDELDSIRQSIIETKIAQEEWNDQILDIRIQKLQDEKEALEKQNSLLDRQLKIEQAISDLEEARSQKNKLIFREGVGFVYEADQDAINDAQEALDDAYYDEMLAKFDDAIDALEELKDKFNIYDSEGNKLDSSLSDMTNRADDVVSDVLSKSDDFQNLIPYDDYFDQLPKINNDLLMKLIPTDEIKKQFDLKNIDSFGSDVSYLAKDISIHIDEINLPNVQNAENFAKELSQLLPLYLKQNIYNN